VVGFVVVWSGGEEVGAFMIGMCFCGCCFLAVAVMDRIGYCFLCYGQVWLLQIGSFGCTLLRWSFGYDCSAASFGVVVVLSFCVFLRCSAYIQLQFRVFLCVVHKLGLNNIR